MAYKLTGRIISVGNTQELTAKSGNIYTQRDFVVMVRKFDPYTGQPTDDEGNTPKFSLFGERCKDLNGIFKGDIVIVSFDIRGRSYLKNDQTEYFTEVRPIRVEKVAQIGCPIEAPLAETEIEEPRIGGGQKVSVAEILEEKKKEAAKPQDDDDLPF